MKRVIGATALLVILGAAVIISGCSQVDEATVREIAREEAMNAVDSYTRAFTPDKFGFGVAWEKEWSYAQGVKTGNMIFVAGQLAHGQKVDENGMPEFLMGDFEQQLRATLENVKAVLANYGATMDDVVFLQNFVATETRSGNKAGNYNPIASKLISEYFPNGLHAMTFAEVAGLYGDAQLVESNAIAIVNK
ncbi:MAG: RidA family protein [Candidatus Latescibacteria bacterium]|jgi:2-iminobutanoate/2-iminopropanoate deaminase|nr:RidA family protein [Candidatus Latescibacterota bacterium]